MANSECFVIALKPFHMVHVIIILTNANLGKKTTGINDKNDVKYETQQSEKYSNK